MAEILASIKKVLAENGIGNEVASPSAEVKLPKISLPVREQEPEVPTQLQVSAAPQSDVLNEENLCENPVEENAENEDKNPYVYIESEEEEVKNSEECEKVVAQNVSDEIINSFTRMFEQNDFKRQTEQPQFDADALLRQIVNQAVSEKLNNKFLQATVKETVVPVLEEWLSHYLPKLIAEEVERVMVKTGRR